MAINPYAQYQQQSLMTMTQGELLIKVYDGLIKFLYASIDAIDKKDYENANLNLKKSQDILSYLKQNLNYDYEISTNLSMLYTFFRDQCIEANLKKDSKILTPIVEMVQELRDTYVIADKKARLDGIK